jgi:hypothetical protein
MHSTVYVKSLEIRNYLFYFHNLRELFISPAQGIKVLGAGRGAVGQNLCARNQQKDFTSSPLNLIREKGFPLPFMV